MSNNKIVNYVNAKFSELVTIKGQISKIITEFMWSFHQRIKKPSQVSICCKGLICTSQDCLFYRNLINFLSVFPNIFALFKISFNLQVSYISWSLHSFKDCGHKKSRCANSHNLSHDVLDAEDMTKRSGGLMKTNSLD